MTWLTATLADKVRADLSIPPPLEATCFYGNPLGAMAAKGDECKKEYFGTKSDEDTGSIFGWPPIEFGRAMNGAGVSQATRKEIDDYPGVHMNAYSLMIIWEWLWALKNKDSKRLARFCLDIFNPDNPASQPYKKDMGSLYLRLLNGYELVTSRALEYLHKNDAAVTLDKIPEDCFPECSFNKCSTRIVTSTQSAANQLSEHRKNNNNNQAIGFNILNAPPIAALLVATIPRNDSDEMPDDNYKDQIRAALEGNFPINTLKRRLDAWRVGVSNKGKRGRTDSPTARLMVAIAIENWLRSSADLTKALEAAWEQIVEQLPAEHAPLPPAEETATAINLNNLFNGQQRKRFAAPDSQVVVGPTWPLEHILPNATIANHPQTIIEVLVKYPDWLGAQKIVTVIHTMAKVNGELKTESMYAEILDVEDEDDSGETVRLKVSPYQSGPPLLSLWPKAKTISIRGVLTQRVLRGTLEPVLGIAVYLTEFGSE